MAKRLIPFDKIANEHPCFLDPEEQPDWKGLFQNEHPLKLEIGFGNGNFLIDMAIREPQSNFIGLDFYRKGIRKVITRMDPTSPEEHSGRLWRCQRKNSDSVR